MRRSVIKAKLARNEPVLLTLLHFTDPIVYEMASMMGFDGLWLDYEHHPHGEREVTAMMRAARVGTADILARPAKGEFAKLSRLLEIGAQGIMYPRCDDAAEAAEVVKWGKFYPLGERGIDSSNSDSPFHSLLLPEYIKKANEETFMMIQIEDPRALERADEIAAVEGVDILFLGSADFSILSGIVGDYDNPIITKAFERMAKAAEKAGKQWGTVALSTDHAKRMLDMGARLLCTGCDIVLLRDALQKIQEQYSPLGFQFNNQVFPAK